MSQERLIAGNNGAPKSKYVPQPINDEQVSSFFYFKIILFYKIYELLMI